MPAPSPTSKPRRGLAAAAEHLHAPTAQDVQLVAEAEHVVAGQLEAQERLTGEGQLPERAAVGEPKTARAAAGETDGGVTGLVDEPRAVAHEAVLLRAVRAEVHVDRVDILPAGKDRARGIRAVLHALERIRHARPVRDLRRPSAAAPP